MSQNVRHLGSNSHNHFREDHFRKLKTHRLAPLISFIFFQYQKLTFKSKFVLQRLDGQGGPRGFSRMFSFDPKFVLKRLDGQGGPTGFSRMVWVCVERRLRGGGEGLTRRAVVFQMDRRPRRIAQNEMDPARRLEPSMARTSSRGGPQRGCLSSETTPRSGLARFCASHLLERSSKLLDACMSSVWSKAGHGTSRRWKAPSKSAGLGGRLSLSWQLAGW